MRGWKHAQPISLVRSGEPLWPRERTGGHCMRAAGGDLGMDAPHGLSLQSQAPRSVGQRLDSLTRDMLAQVTAGSPESSSEDDDITGSSEEADEETSPERKSKGRFKKFLTKFRMTSTKTKDDEKGGGKRSSGTTARLGSPGEG